MTQSEEVIIEQTEEVKVPDNILDSVVILNPSEERLLHALDNIEYFSDKQKEQQQSADTIQKDMMVASLDMLISRVKNILDDVQTIKTSEPTIEQEVSDQDIEYT